MRSSDHKSISVLLVEDSIVIRERLCMLLAEERNIRIVAEASDAGPALELFRAHAPQAVILDLQLRTSSGLEVLTKIKQSDPGCIVLVLTNHTQTEFREACHQRGADYFFHKTTEFEKVVEVLSALADLRPLSPQDSEPLPPAPKPQP